MKLKVFKNGALVTMERQHPGGLYVVLLRDPSGEVHDKVRCDDYQEAMAMRRAFEAIAKNMKGA